jgi:phosphatidylglycerol:prolipoprotein diacylglycerol transferase
VAGIVFGWIGVEVAKRLTGLRRSTGPVFALALAAGEAVGRIGCHFNECCYGREWSGPLAVFQQGASRFPVQMLSAVYAAVVFFVVLRFRTRVAERQVFPLYLALFAFGRFFLEYLRGGSPTFGPLTVAQWVCIEVAVSVLLVHGALAVIERRRARA